MDGERSVSGDLSGVNGAAHHDNNNDIILEATLFRRSSYDIWLPRYFVFSSDHTLAYYHKKGGSSSGRPRQTFVVSREAGCEVSNLYVSQRHQQSSTGAKELLYCFKLTWPTNDNEEDDDIDDNMSQIPEGMNDSFIGGLRDDCSSVGSAPPYMKSTTGHVYAPSDNILDEDINYLFEAYGADDDDDGAENGEQDSNSEQHPLVSATPGAEGMMRLKSDETPPAASSDRSIDSDSILIGKNTRGNTTTTTSRHHSSLSAINFSTSTVKKMKKKLQFPKKAFKGLTLTRSTSTGSTRKNNGRMDHPISEELFPPNEEGNTIINNNSGIEASMSGDNMDASLKRTERVQRMYAKQKMKERDQLRQEFITKKKAKKKKQEKMLMQGTKVAAAATAAAGVAVLTAGVGLVAGLAFVGIGAAAGAGSSASVLGLPKRAGKSKEIIIATACYEEAKEWKSTIDQHLEYENLKRTTWGRILFSEGNSNSAFLARDQGEILDDRKLSRDKAFLFEPTTQWTPLDGWAVSLLGTGNQGLRIFREEKSLPDFHDDANSRPVKRILTNLSVDSEGGICPPMKAHVVLNTSPLNAFMCIMSYARMAPNGSNMNFLPQSEQATSFRVLESIDDHMDIVHLVFRPMYLFPSWTSPRDFVLVRYWRYEPDGSYVICYESVQHRDCPATEGFVRGEMHAAYTVSPRTQIHMKKSASKFDSMAQECLLTAVVQVNPRGWVPICPLPFISLKCYGSAFGIAALLQLLDIRDAIDRDRFVAAALDIEPPTTHFQAKAYNGDSDELVMQASVISGRSDDRNYDFTYSARESTKIKDSTSGLPAVPPPFYTDGWAEPDSNSFLVRGPSYKVDQVKINAGQSIGRLLATDICEVTAPIYSGMSKHPNERIQLALQKEKMLKAKGLPSDVPPFIFVLNIVLPADPLYHMVFYYAVDDMSEIDGTSGTPTSKLCNEFFFGDSDEFRDKTFKLIPQIVQGNFMVRRAVGTTPAIMGKKLRQLYVKDEENKRFFEIVLDCCSSSVAAGVIRLSLGYAKTLVIDIGFLFEGDDETVLPERLFGGVRLKNADFGMPIRKVEPPSPIER